MVCVAGVASSYEAHEFGSVVVVGWSVSQAWPALTRAWDWWLCGGRMVCVAGVASSYEAHEFGSVVVVGWSVSQAWPALTRRMSLVALWWLDGPCRRRGQLLRGRGIGGFVVAGWFVSQAWPALTRVWVVVAGWPVLWAQPAVCCGGLDDFALAQ